MSDSSFEDSVVYALTSSRGYPPVMRRVSSSNYKVLPCLLSSTIRLGLDLIGSVYGHG